jgi:hypothetical protein
VNGAQVDNGLESIRIGDSKTSFTDAHCVIAFNRFEDCDGEIEIISNKSCHNSYLHNTFYNCDGGLTLRHGNHTLCDGNYFDGGKKNCPTGSVLLAKGMWPSIIISATCMALRMNVSFTGFIIEWSCEYADQWLLSR